MGSTQSHWKSCKDVAVAPQKKEIRAGSNPDRNPHAAKPVLATATLEWPRLPVQGWPFRPLCSLKCDVVGAPSPGQAWTGPACGRCWTRRRRQRGRWPTSSESPACAPVPSAGLWTHYAWGGAGTQSCGRVVPRGRLPEVPFGLIIPVTRPPATPLDPVPGSGRAQFGGATGRPLEPPLHGSKAAI